MHMQQAINFSNCGKKERSLSIAASSSDGSAFLAERSLEQNICAAVPLDVAIKGEGGHWSEMVIESQPAQPECKITVEGGEAPARETPSYSFRTLIA